MSIRIAADRTVGQVRTVFAVLILTCLFAVSFSWAESPAAVADTESAALNLSPPRVIHDCIGSETARTIARCGEGWLEEINGYRVLHLKGTPYEMGFQHGTLLQANVRENLHNLLNVRGSETFVRIGELPINPKLVLSQIIEIQRPFVSEHFTAEMDGLAAGAGVDPQDIRLANFIPELFHCSGFTVGGDATVDGTLYHGRVLDYATDWGLQDHAVLIVAEPDDGIPYVNITYAGFVGSVTGMNARSISIGEMGGAGLGNWLGVPMAQLVRQVIESAETLDEAIAVFENNPRTCQYFYVIADGKTGDSVGMEATWEKVTVIRPGEQHPFLPYPVSGCALMSAGDRYRELVRRVKTGNGQFTAESALVLMDRPVAMKSNLHNVLFEPATTRFWVANAASDRRPAAEQPYYLFQLSDLLSRQPGVAETP